MTLSPFEQEVITGERKAIFDWKGTAEEWNTLMVIRKAVELQRAMHKAFARTIWEIIHA